MNAVSFESFTLDECPACLGIWFGLDEPVAIKEYLDRVDREAASPHGEDGVPKIREKTLQRQAMRPVGEEGVDDFGEKLKDSYLHPYDHLARNTRRWQRKAGRWL